jgi:hypothetical protein
MNLTTQEADTIARLATKAHEEGIRRYRDRRDGRHYATSATTPGRLYMVALASCTWMGFVSHGRCKHWAALTMAVLNKPEGNEPEVITPPACLSCHGEGEIHTERMTGTRQIVSVWECCPTYHGAGTRDLEPIAA